MFRKLKFIQHFSSLKQYTSITKNGHKYKVKINEKEP